jgi:hypothetical protein
MRLFFVVFMIFSSIHAMFLKQKFGYILELVRHQEVHSELQLECGICGKKFRSQLGNARYLGPFIAVFQVSLQS